MKKIVFLDAFGTLWYPKNTKNDKDPSWPLKVYGRKNYAIHMILTPSVRLTLTKLKGKNIYLVLISAVPGSTSVELRNLKKMVRVMGLTKFFDEIHTVKITRGGKGPTIAKTLKRLNIPKKEALMIGDAYWFDYKSVKNIGVDALLFYSNYQRSKEPKTKRIKRRIKNLYQLFKYLN